ncbi:MAG: phage tail sheath family protein [Clostridia bacterium]|nr:phage tail sheath family protein [Clostridia bacterium]
METYRHGVYVREADTALQAPITGTAGLQVVVGTAPVHLLDDPAAAVNTPILAHSYKEAVTALGYSDDFAAYTLCESISASFQVLGVAPLVLINVLDPARHSAEVSETVLAVNGGIATLAVTGILRDSLTVSTETGTALARDTDYITAFAEDGTLTLTLIEGGAGEGSATLTVSGRRLDPTLVTAADILGGIDGSTGAERGLEVIRQVYPKLQLVPGILLAPRFSADPAVAAGLQAKTTALNGDFQCVAIVDIDCTEKGAIQYTDVKEQKERQALTASRCYAVWPFAKVGETVYSGSSLAAALTAYTDAENGDVPHVSPSNKSLSISAACLADGTEVVLDQEQANTVNSFGVATFLRLSGFRLWGNNTVAYPATTDPKDRWFSVRRFFCWTAVTFILTYFERVDDPMNPRLIEAIVDSENIRGNSFVARSICAGYEITFPADENPATDLLNGKLTFHQKLAPYPPAEVIENVLEFDPDALAAALT